MTHVSRHQPSRAGLLSGGLALVVFLGAACHAGPVAEPGVRLHTPAGRTSPVIDIVGLEDRELRALGDAALSREQWTGILRIAVADDQPAVLGEYAVAANALRFTPLFPLDAGREYLVSFRASAIPGVAGDDRRAFSGRVSLPAVIRESSTVVAQIFPSSEAIPENQLRLYIHFSAPMGRKGGLDYIKLLDDAGREVVDPFLPLDAEFWNADYTRYTVFFDPGRQKRGILPNQVMGRSLEIGKRYAIVVSRDWPDANGSPLAQEFRKEFRAGAADEHPIDAKAWGVAAPAAGTRDALVVTFPEPLDHGLLLRALGVTGADGRFLDGDVGVHDGEKRWTFAPREAWRAATYRLTALAMLEDLAGNRIGRAFEVDNFERADRTPEPERTTIAFTVTAR